MLQLLIILFIQKSYKIHINSSIEQLKMLKLNHNMIIKHFEASVAIFMLEKITLNTWFTKCIKKVHFLISLDKLNDCCRG